MARVRGKDTKPEIVLRRALWRRGFRYRLGRRIERSRPDLVLPGPKVAVFVDGCFWHGCPEHYTRPRSSSAFWSGKLAANVERDRRHTLALEADGWRVVRVWEHDVWSDLDGTVERLRAARDDGGWQAPRTWRVVRVDPAPNEGVDWERRELELLRDPACRRSEVGPRNTSGDETKAVEASQ